MMPGQLRAAPRSLPPQLGRVLPGAANSTAEPTNGVVSAPRITDDLILFGQSAAFNGPARELGSNMRLGILAAFQEVNEAGGVHGRRLELVSLDDAYEPEAAIANTLRLIEEERVFALIGAVGTPTSRSATPHRRRCRSSLRRSLHRRRLPARPRVGEHHQPALLLQSGDRGDGGPADRRPGH